MCDDRAGTSVADMTKNADAAERLLNDPALLAWLAEEVASLTAGSDLHETPPTPGEGIEMARAYLLECAWAAAPDEEGVVAA